MNGKGRYGHFIRVIFTGVDFLILNFVYFVVCLTSDVDKLLWSKAAWLILNGSFAISAYFFSDIHSRRVAFADVVTIQAIKSVLVFAAVFTSLLWFVSIDDLAWFTLLKFFLCLGVCLASWWIISRKMLKLYRTHGFNYKRIIIIGSGSVGRRLMEELESDLGYGYRILGVFDDGSFNKRPRLYKGTLDDVEGFVKEHNIDEMYYAKPESKKELTDMVKVAERNAVDFYFVPQIGSNFTRRFELYSIENLPILSIRPNPLSSTFNMVVKRTFDIVVSSIVLLLSPLVLIPVAIGIKLTSPGPIFFKQKRTGYRGIEFDCYKFRTMKVNADSDKVQATKDDPRKTRFGNFLRKSSIDELPQFYNVFKGDMSIVGPRPHMIKHTEDYSKLIDKYMVRHTVKPGITGWAQVNGFRGPTEQLWQMEKRVEYDVWYTENWNFMLDLKIMLLTVVNAIKGESNAV